MAVLTILKNLIQAEFDEIASGEYLIEEEIVEIYEDNANVNYLEQSALLAIQREVDSRIHIGKLSASASRYTLSNNISLDFTLSFNIKTTNKTDILADVETVRIALKETEEAPVSSGGYDISFSVNRVVSQDISFTSGNFEYCKILFAGSVTFADDALLGQSIKHYLKIGTGSYTQIVGVTNNAGQTDMKVTDNAQSGQVTRENTPVTNDCTASINILYRGGNSLHATLLGYAMDNTQLFTYSAEDGYTPVQFSYKRTMGATTLAEWTKCYLLTPSYNAPTGGYVTLTLTIARSS